METKRTLAQVMALLPDNTSGLISPQDLRDAITSVFDTWAMMYLSTPANQSIFTSSTKIVDYNASNNSSGGAILPSHSGGDIAINLDGTYAILFGMSLYGTVSQTVTVKAYKDYSAPITIQKGCRITGKGSTEYLDFTGFAITTGMQVVSLYGTSSPSISTIYKYQQFLAAIKIG